MLMVRTKEEMTNYLLACLAEECGEVTQLCGKALRFGAKSYGENNTMTLGSIYNEVQDVLAVWFMLSKLMGITSHVDPDFLQRKIDKVTKYSDLQYFEGHE
jgi:NTP pyrophosphatase (non-canonical NTP hydrolase)